MSGRPPKLQNMKTGAYSKATKQAQEESLPIYQSQEFIPPKSLNKKELEVWGFIVNVFRQTRNCQASDADIYLMQMYCRDKVMLDEAAERWRKNPDYWVKLENGVDKNGDVKYIVKANPNYVIIKDKTASCMKISDQLGLSPLGRARAGVKGANAKIEEDLFASILNRSDDEE